VFNVRVWGLRASDKKRNEPHVKEQAFYVLTQNTMKMLN